MENLGKVEQSLLEQAIISNCGAQRPEVYVGPGFGIDVALVDLGNGMSLASTSDPLSLIPSLGLQESAWLSVHLMANDMATTSFAPMYGQFVLNLPAVLSEDSFREYWNYIDMYCKEIGTAITGGHTCFIEGQNSTISGGGTFSAVAKTDEILVSKNAQVSNKIIVTKSAAISSSAILSMSFPETIGNKLGSETQLKGSELFYKTSSLSEALIARQLNEREKVVTAMHDVTEGGVMGAIYEMTMASGCGVLVDKNEIPVEEYQRAICSLFCMDPTEVIGAGSMIIAVKNGSELTVVDSLKEAGIEATVVGTLMEKEKGRKVMVENEISEMHYKDKDPYWEAYFRAYQSGWK